MLTKMRSTLTLLSILGNFSGAVLGQEVKIGNFITRNHDVEGEVYALSDRVLEVRNMVYDGLGPAAYFWADMAASPTDDGFRMLDSAGENCAREALPRANVETVRFEFPEGKTIHDIVGGSISVWCEAFSANFGEVVVESSLDLSGLPITGVTDGAPQPGCAKKPAKIGNFVTRNHEVAGEVYALSDRVMEVRNMFYDGLGPAAYFWADTNAVPSDDGFRLLDAADGNCANEAIAGATGEIVRFEFPEGKTIHSIIGGSISVWCEAFSANFGEVVIDANLDLSNIPNTGITAGAPTLSCAIRSIKVGMFTTRNHEVAGEVYALSDRVMEVRNMFYDGLGPAAYFWGDASASPSDGGFRLLDTAEGNCANEAIPAASGETVRFEFPEGRTIHDIAGGSISVWCEAFSANFGEVVIDANLDLSALATTGVTPGAPLLACSDNPTSTIAITPAGFSCEPLTDDFQVRWKVADNNEIEIQLVGRIEDDAYMAFGVSGDPSRALMLGADPVVADFFGGEARARDFYMDDRAQCSTSTGVCPDPDGWFSNDVVQGSVSGERADGLTLVRYRRPTSPTDVDALSRSYAVDKAISVQPGTLTTVVWALGPVDQESGNPFFHRFGESRDLIQFDFGRDAQDNCEPLTSDGDDQEEETLPFLRPVLTDVTEFRANIGPSGGERGYASISGGRTAWGIAWYINDVLVPIIEMRRGTKYRFLVSGGNDPASSSEHHPFYLTTSISGGYIQKSPKERADETTFGGIQVVNGTEDAVYQFEATTQAPGCFYGETDESADAAAGGYLSYFNSLDTSCASDSAITDAAAVLEFTPDASTPDLIYYQCVTHTNLGWEIRVIDEDAESILDVNCESFGAAPIKLTNELTLNAIIDPIENLFKAELVYDGIGWVGMAFTDGRPVMVGAEAVIGLPDEPNSAQNPAKYNLNARNVPGVVRMADEKQTLKDASITQSGGKTILKFTKLLAEPGEHQIFADRTNTMLFAHGSSNSLGFHAAFGGFDILPNQCAVRISGELQNAHALSQQGEVGVEAADLNRPLWMWHGICASVAWAILVPLAIGASLIRKVLVKVGLPPSAWFQLHRGLNMLAAMLTLIAFSLAVRAINKGTVNGADPEHFSGITHRRTGLVIFLLTMAQAINGILRPHLPEAHTESNSSETSEGDAENAEVNLAPAKDKTSTSEESPQKSVQRQGWEIGHRLLGAALIGLTWFQVQDGLGLFAERFDEENLDTVFWIVVSCIAGSIGLLAMYQRVAL